MKNLRRELKERILLLDGGLGTMIQKNGFQENDFRGREFLKHPLPLFGCNDILNLTKPQAIQKIHEDYLRSGADIITTNTFNANSISLKDYGLDSNPELVKRINREGVMLARNAISSFEIDKKPSKHFVAGSIGPTNRSVSMSPDITDPEKRNITYDILYNAYRDQIEGLIEGGTDLLLFETFYDTLNLKAGLDAANQIMAEKGVKLPIMVSATVSNNAGYLLTGQSLPAFITSISGYDNDNIISIGLNCGFGPEEMSGFIEEISNFSPHYISCHPNAGLPDENGSYNFTPNQFVSGIKKILDTGKINILGGCCGTTPQHIAILKELLSSYKPYSPLSTRNGLSLSGNEIFTIKPGTFTLVGERCNVAGSKKFLRLIKENNLEEAIEIAGMQVKQGAGILDINMDDPLLDGKNEIVRFIRYIESEPLIAKSPLMIDSSNWDIIETALKNIPGKGIVNSLSLKEGEEVFLKRAKRVKELGFALIVMTFDEKGPGDTYERKIEICQRAYTLLREKCGFKPEDIIFDVGVMAIATGMPEHAMYASNFIRAVEWIKLNLPGALTSGGISNLSFSFRGKNRIREILHSIFLHHAIKAGLDMAIVNPAALPEYSEIERNLRELIEDVLLTGNQESETALLNLVLEPEKKNATNSDFPTPPSDISVEQRLQNAMISGELKNLTYDLDEALAKYNGNVIDIVEGPLMEGMKTVGDLFSEGKMFLPQVIKTARVMNSAVEYLKPHLQNINSDSQSKSGKIVIATVKGDVHDIGKNIVATVLNCNNYEIIDLGVMVPPEKIVEAIKIEKPDILCLSGLITPSLSEMRIVIDTLEKEKIDIPVIVGGAATSKLHTALKIAPYYSGIVIHAEDASKNPVMASELLNENKRENYIHGIKEEYRKLRNKNDANARLIPYNQLLQEAKICEGLFHKPTKPAVEIGKPIFFDLKNPEIICLINWKMFFHAWKLTGSYLKDFPFSTDEVECEKWLTSLKDDDLKRGEEALELYKVAKAEIEEILTSPGFDGKAVLVFKVAYSDEKNIYTGSVTLPMLRQQTRDSQLLSCCDFINKKDTEIDYIGFFALTAGEIWNKKAEQYEAKGDKYRAMIIRTLADRYAEASSEWLHAKVKKELWGYGTGGIRPAWGYPMLPDQELIHTTVNILPYEKIGIRLTENGAMYPQASVSGLYISNKDSRYFIVGEIGEDQITDYAHRRRIEVSKMKRLLRQF
ncbi:MAG: methionine synthase [Muribaculaceae bacterium]|nr:methionine synthase [Muribaculaceae bacterium]